MKGYPILEITDTLREAAGWIDRCDRVVGETFCDGQTGEQYPTPKELDEAQALWQQAWDLLGHAAAKLKPLADAEKARCDAEDDREVTY